jgi:hypothetical protein
MNRTYRLQDYVRHSERFGTEGIIEAARRDLTGDEPQALIDQTGARWEIGDIHAEEAARLVARIGTDAIRQAVELLIADLRDLNRAMEQHPDARTAANFARRDEIDRKVLVLAQRAADKHWRPDPTIRATRLLEDQTGIGIENLRRARRQRSRRSARTALVRALRIIVRNRLATRADLGAALQCGPDRITRLIAAG